MNHRRNRPVVASPFLTGIELLEDRTAPGTFPFNLAVLSQGFNLQISTPITFFVGENGSGKSTLLEALAWSAGFGSKGGSRDHKITDDAESRNLGGALRLSWRQRVHAGFFLRAETFFDFASYLTGVGSSLGVLDGRPLHDQSHGEAFPVGVSEPF